MTVEVRDLIRRFGATPALDGVSFALRDGEFAAVLGPSGSGKTTLLRVLAGLDFPQSGSLRIAGRDMAEVPARERGVGVVFQHYALFRHMTVFENVAFGLRVRPRGQRLAPAEIARRVRDLLGLVQIAELERRYPDQISGGQRQRVALARALAIAPPLLLLDEPFGALDAQVRKGLRRWLRDLHDQLGITSILVTHDQHEAMEMADRVAVMERGRIVQFDVPSALIDAPATPFVAGFVGEASRLSCRIAGGLAHFDPLDLPPLRVALPDGPGIAFVRPADVLADPAPDAEGATGLVRLVRREPGGETMVVADLAGAVLDAVVVPGRAPPQRGGCVRLRLRAAQVFSEAGRRALGMPWRARDDVVAPGVR